MPITVLETALYSKLTGASGLITELGGTFVYNRLAPQDVGDKYVIFQQQGGGDVNDTPVRSRNVLYSIFAVASTPEASAAIDDQVDAALHLQALSVTGWSDLWMARETDVQFTELDSAGVPRYRTGGIYRILIDKE